METFGEKPAFVWRGNSYSYAQTCDAVRTWTEELDRLGVKPGDVIAVHGNYSPQSCALILALALRRTIVVPLASVGETLVEEFLGTAGAHGMVIIAADGSHSWRPLDPGPVH